MVKRYYLMLILALLPTGLIGSFDPPRAAGRDIARVLNRIWQVTSAPSKPALGSMYVFLTNGTLLEGSCVETYRIATWSADQRVPSVLRVMEDKRLAFTAVITEVTDRKLRLRQKLAHSNEIRDITLEAVEQEFVCPDRPKYTNDQP